MRYQTSFIVLFATVLAFNFVECFTKWDIEISENSVNKNWLRSLFGPKSRSEPSIDEKVQKNTTKLYTFGKSVSGEYKVDAWNNQIYHNEIGDDGFCIFYGHKLTYAKFIAEQTSELGSAYIFAGGMGEDFVMFCIQAKETLNFRVHAEIFSLEQPRGKFSVKFLPLF